MLVGDEEEGEEGDGKFAECEYVKYPGRVRRSGG
jgi:hypothetical protein